MKNLLYLLLAYLIFGKKGTPALTADTSSLSSKFKGKGSFGLDISDPSKLDIIEDGALIASYPLAKFPAIKYNELKDDKGTSLGIEVPAEERRKGSIEIEAFNDDIAPILEALKSRSLVAGSTYFLKTSDKTPALLNWVTQFNLHSSGLDAYGVEAVSGSRLEYDPATKYLKLLNGATETEEVPAPEVPAEDAETQGTSPTNGQNSLLTSLGLSPNMLQEAGLSASDIASLLGIKPGVSGGGTAMIPSGSALPGSPMEVLNQANTLLVQAQPLITQARTLANQSGNATAKQLAQQAYDLGIKAYGEITSGQYANAVSSANNAIYTAQQAIAMAQGLPVAMA